MPYIPHYVVGHPVVADICKPLGRCRYDDYYCSSCEDGCHSRKINLFFSYNQINCASCEDWKIKRKRHCNNRQGKGNYKQRNISLHVA